jgi:DNA invertase Pin-like site-specific DNA recombinase
LALVAEFERGRIAERMSDGRKGKRQRNGHLGGEPPYGFMVVGEKRQSKLEPHPQEKPIVDEILKLSKKKLTSWKIMQAVNAQGLQNRDGKPFECFQVKRIIERANASHG